MPYVFAAILVLVLGGFLLLRSHPTPPPAPSSAPSAMCYAAVRPPESIDFVCPRDGSRTQYPTSGALAERVRNLPKLQAMTRALARETTPRVTIALDLSEFCRLCTPNPPATPEAVLSVKMPSHKETRTRGIAPDDLVLLEEFFLGSTSHQAADGKIAPLEESLSRIRVLIGVPDAKLEKNNGSKKRSSPQHPVMKIRDEGKEQEWQMP